MPSIRSFRRPGALEEWLEQEDRKEGIVKPKAKAKAAPKPKSRTAKPKPKSKPASTFTKSSSSKVITSTIKTSTSSKEKGSTNTSISSKSKSESSSKKMNIKITKRQMNMMARWTAQEIDQWMEEEEKRQAGTTTGEGSSSKPKVPCDSKKVNISASSSSKSSSSRSVPNANKPVSTKPSESTSVAKSNVKVKKESPTTPKKREKKKKDSTTKKRPQIKISKGQMRMMSRWTPEEIDAWMEEEEKRQEHNPPRRNNRRRTTRRRSVSLTREGSDRPQSKPEDLVKDVVLDFDRSAPNQTRKVQTSKKRVCINGPYRKIVGDRAVEASYHNYYIGVGNNRYAEFVSDSASVSYADIESQQFSDTKCDICGRSCGLLFEARAAEKTRDWERMRLLPEVIYASRHCLNNLFGNSLDTALRQKEEEEEKKLKGERRVAAFSHTADSNEIMKLADDIIQGSREHYNTEEADHLVSLNTSTVHYPSDGESSSSEESSPPIPIQDKESSSSSSSEDEKEADPKPTASDTSDSDSDQSTDSKKAIPIYESSEDEMQAPKKKEESTDSSSDDSESQDEATTKLPSNQSSDLSESDTDAKKGPTSPSTTKHFHQDLSSDEDPKNAIPHQQEQDAKAEKLFNDLESARHGKRKQEKHGNGSSSDESNQSPKAGKSVPAKVSDDVPKTDGSSSEEDNWLLRKSRAARLAKGLPPKPEVRARSTSSERRKKRKLERQKQREEEEKERNWRPPPLNRETMKELTPGSAYTLASQPTFDLDEHDDCDGVLRTEKPYHACGDEYVTLRQSQKTNENEGFWFWRCHHPDCENSFLGWHQPLPMCFCGRSSGRRKDERTGKVFYVCDNRYRKCSFHREGGPGMPSRGR